LIYFPLAAIKAKFDARFKGNSFKSKYDVRPMDWKVRYSACEY